MMQKAKTREQIADEYGFSAKTLFMAATCTTGLAASRTAATMPWSNPYSQ